MTRFIIQDDVIDDKLGSFIAFDFTVLSKEEVMMDVCEYLNRLWNQTQRFEKENKELKDELYEVKKDYLIETADISDKIHLEEDLKKLHEEIYGGLE